ncbi:hypothetical protein L1987_34480 [Smallanthus sonchifolius]|uniref:Uncharacterized protein n=1 Tax=Smallanthus sonchifolius TaxID=185202 RepID=A0ACB9HVN2_9ASTR|nr:hypothetical protein L1987_34480 [Smallanthus sonchifolius]
MFTHLLWFYYNSSPDVRQEEKFEDKTLVEWVFILYGFFRELMVIGSFLCKVYRFNFEGGFTTGQEWEKLGQHDRRNLSPRSRSYNMGSVGLGHVNRPK